jgi:hypothetical protein
MFADHRATDFTLSKTFETAQWKCCTAFLQIFIMKSGARTIKQIFRFIKYLSTFFYTYLPLNIHFQLIIITNVSLLTDPAYFVPPSCHCCILALRSRDLSDNSKRKTRVRFVYVLPEVLHGDFLSEIKYLVNLEWNILQILTRNVIFFYGYSNWGELSFNIFKFFM